MMIMRNIVFAKGIESWDDKIPRTSGTNIIEVRLTFNSLVDLLTAHYPTAEIPRTSGTNIIEVLLTFSSLVDLLTTHYPTAAEMWVHSFCETIFHFGLPSSTFSSD
jgi:hypothetical protein